jgi:hypothetical protein
VKRRRKLAARATVDPHVTTTSAPYRATDLARTDLRRWRAATQGAAWFVVGVVVRIVVVAVASVTVEMVPYNLTSIRLALAISSITFAVTGLCMLVSLVRFARLPRPWNGGVAPIIASLVAAGCIALDVANLERLRAFIPTRAPIELSNLVDAWSDVHRLSSLITAAMPILLLLPMARIANTLDDATLAQRAKLIAMYIPIAVVSVGVMLYIGYGPTSIVVPGGLPIGGPFGFVTEAIAGVFAALMLRLRRTMARYDGN